MLPSMFGLKPELPVSEEDRQWVDDGFNRLSRMLGHKRMLEESRSCPMRSTSLIPMTRSASAAEKMLCRICDYMKVDRSQIELEIFPDETES